MKTINIIAVLRGDWSDPKFVPLKLTFPDFDYDGHSLEKIIRDIDWGKVDYKTGYPIIYKFEDEHSKMLRDYLDWSSAKDLQYIVSKSVKYGLENAWTSTFGKRRVREFEPKFAECESTAEIYIKKCVNPDWISWTEEELVISPVFMFNYALQVCKGRLPDHLDNAMLLASYKTPDSTYVKRYFKTKRYRIRSGKSLLNKAEA